MRTETLWQRERRAARMQWWYQVLDCPAAVNRKELFDEELMHRFGTPEAGRGSIGPEARAVTPC